MLESYSLRLTLTLRRFLIISSSTAISYTAFVHYSVKIENNSHIAIIDASASTHMPDVLEVPYTPKILNAEIHTKENTINNNSLIYTLGGNTCMTGDIIGTYRFDDKLHTNDKIIFTDMMQYTTVKNTTFNGVPLPNIGILHENGKYELIKKFNYKDFEDRL